LDVGVSSSSGSVLDANTKSALVQLRQKFKV
jgi:hypothetical protein